MNSTEVPGRLIQIPRVFKKKGDVSLAALLEASGYTKHYATVAPTDIEDALANDTALIGEWLSYSQDKRTSSGWYFREQGGNFEIGQVLHGRIKPKEQFADAMKACAAFIRLEAESIRLGL